MQEISPGLGAATRIERVMRHQAQQYVPPCVCKAEDTLVKANA
jgi:hypothetical protein